MRILDTAIDFLTNNYKGEIPLAAHLKAYFKDHPKLGSRDRRAIGDALYTYFRFARLQEEPKMDNSDVWPVLQFALENNILTNPVLEKMLIERNNKPANISLTATDFELILSEGITESEYLDSLKLLPATFIRLRKNQAAAINKLQDAQIAFEQKAPNILAFKNGINLAKVIPEKHYVIQDYSSQRSLDAFKKISKFAADKTFSVWDTCSGAGGKTLLLKDYYTKAQVTCTDIRHSILHNLKARADLYGHEMVRTEILDASDAKKVANFQAQFDLVMSDVPCTGSGTWARTPEQFHFFDLEKIETFSTLQTKIATNAASKVKENGFLVYITCSVFKEENELVVANILEKYPHFKLHHQALIKGIEDQADCMFVAVLQNL